jgi:hypothetical protein
VPEIILKGAPEVFLKYLSWKVNCASEIMHGDASKFVSHPLSWKVTIVIITVLV